MTIILYIVDGNGMRISGTPLHHEPTPPLRIERHDVPSYPPLIQAPEPGIPDHIILGED